MVRFKDFVFTSGQVGIDVNGNLVSKDFDKQTERAFENIEELLKQEKLSLKNVIKITAFLVNRKHYRRYNEIRARYFHFTHPPASSSVIVKGLVHPDYLIEIEAVAAVE